MHFDLTITVTAILAIAAIISPIATAIINNRYQMKLKELEHQNQVEKDSFFLQARSIRGISKLHRKMHSRRNS